jgi:hypothetical protein
MKRKGPALETASESTRATKRYRREGGESREVEVQNRASWIFGCLGEVEELVRVEVDKLTAMPFPAPIQDIIVSCIVGPDSWRGEYDEGSEPEFEALLFSEFLVDPATQPPPDDPAYVDAMTNDVGYYVPEHIDGILLQGGLYYSKGGDW